jgi:hypothetical protein
VFEGSRLAASSGPDRRQTGLALQARGGDAMTLCHQPAGASQRQIVMFRTRTLLVTGSEAVTRKEAVTRETIVSQGKSSLSPVSLVESLVLYIRAIRVWGRRLSPVTVVTGDSGMRHRGLKPGQTSTNDRCHSAVCNEIKNQKGGIAFPARARARRVGPMEQSGKLEFKNTSPRGRGFRTNAGKKGWNRRLPHPEILASNTNFGKYQDQRKAMKMTTSKNRQGSAIQVSASASRKISRHGGSRPGAGRKPGSGNKPSFPLEPIAEALAKAVAEKPAFPFIEAMRVLEAPLDDTRAALGLSRDQFMQEYGEFISACADLRKRGADAVFADGSALKRTARTGG